MPDWRGELERRLGDLALPPAREAEIVEELAQHMADRYQELRIAGVSETEARVIVLAELSEEKLLARQLRDVEDLRPDPPAVLGTRQRSHFVTGLWQDLRYGIRTLAKSPGFTAVAVSALALGIGANTAVFSVLNGVMLNPLPYPDPQRLVWFWPAEARTGQPFTGSISPPDFVDYRKQSTVFDGLSAFMHLDLTLTGSGETERLPAAAVSAGFFETLGIRPSMGRGFTSGDEQTAWPQVAILSDGLWQGRFGRDPGIVGKTIHLDGKAMTIVGVMPRGFEFPKDVQIWQPLPLGYAEMRVRRFHFLRVIGRLKPGVAIGTAETQMKSICVNLARLYPDSNAQYSSHLVFLSDRMVGDLRPTLRVLMIAVAFVLLIACANVAHLLLARAAARQRELAIRSSLGASAGRVFRQLLAESILLAGLGGAFALVLAWWGLRFLVALHPVNVPRLDEVHLDGRVLAFTAAISILTGIFFGLVPALRSARPDLAGVLNAGGRSGTAARGHRRFHSVLVIVEVAVAVVLLSGAGLMIRSFQRLVNVDPGFKPAHVLAARIQLPRFETRAEAYDPSKAMAFFDPLLDRLKSLPGVESAALVSELPLSGQNNDTWFTIEGRPPLAPSDRPDADQRTISTEYFQTMGIPLIKGRYFTRNDTLQSAKVVIISQSLAERYFPGQNPLGQHLNIDLGLPFRCEIVGVVGDVRHQSLAGPGQPTNYISLAQQPAGRASVVVRGGNDVMTLAHAITQQVQALNHDVPVFEIHSLNDYVADSVGQPRFRTLLLAMFAAVALILAGAGIYGVMSYSVSLRTNELGIRVALGAGRRDLMRLVVGQGMLLALAGVAIGLATAAALARLIAGMLFEVRPSDPLSFAAVPVILGVVAFLANYIPARRAARVDAIVALRHG